ncbi:hypothetical protein JTB14_024058 [Gonioctena quinquepunctata]|nr:hypothetical protein JTB14_024058 [Gonioctena quinquepunctata]
MNVYRLVQDELAYELKTRGIATGTVEQMRHSLAMAIRLEKSGDSLRNPTYPFTMEEDVGAVKGKLVGLAPLVSDFQDSSSSGIFVKIQSTLAHVLNRIGHMDEESEDRPELLAKTLTLSDELIRRAEDFDKVRDTPAHLSFLGQNQGSSTPNPSGRSMTNLAPSTSTVPVVNQSNVRSILPDKWDCKFSGEKRGFSLSAFLERVEELRIARHVSKDILLESGIDLFTGRAYQFYLAYRSDVSTWDEFVDLLREEYLSRITTKSCSKNNKRTQGPDESMGIYLAVMAGYFNRLTCPISEDTKLKILMRNISPFYQTQLALIEVTSISQLRDLSRRLETRKESVESFAAPPRKNLSLEPDLAYVHVDEMIADVCTASTSSDGGNSMEVPPKEIVCYRCNKPGHRAIGCMVRLPKLLEAGKRQPTLLNDRVRGVDRECSVDKLQVLLDFVLDHTVGDERPYLRVEVLGKSLLGLLDSGASRTILGGKGWEVIRELGLQLDGTRTSFCTVANGSQCQGIGAVEMPISLRGRLGLVAAIVVPDLPHLLILGADFWKIMGIVPDLRHNEWHFSNEPVLVNSFEHVSGQTMLTAMEKMRLQAVIDRNMALMGEELGCTNQTEHVILTDSQPIKQRLKEANITVSIEKCQFCRPQMKYLGYVVDRNGLHVDPDKVRAMLELPTPTNVTEVRRVVGTFSWYRRFIPDFSSVIAPITALLRKSTSFHWSEESASAFRRIKECLVSAPILSCPDYSREFVVQTDASGYGVGAVLTQPHDEGDRVISYLSRSLSRQERNYTTTERECLAVLWAVEKLRPYLEGVPFTVVTDHFSLLWLQTLKDLNGRLARWAVRLQQFNFKVIHRKGKENVVPDALSRSVPIVDSLRIDSCSVEDQVLTGTTEDKWYQAMVGKVRNNPLKFALWRESDGRLWKHIVPDYPNLSSPTDSWRLVVPRGDRVGIIVGAHEPPTSGHTGVYKTFARISSRYYWPKMRSDIAKFVRRCVVCASHKVSQDRPTHKMVSHPKVDIPWETISTDLFADKHRTRIKFSASYHPRANPTERINRTLKTMLAMYVSDNHRSWDENLDEIACAIRTSRHEVTKLTP